MKKGLTIASLSALFFLAVLSAGLPAEHAYAQGIAGDSLCGAKGDPCEPGDLKILANKLFLLFASVGTALLFLFIIVRVLSSVYLYMAKGDASALARARAQSFNMMIGYGIIIAVFGGMYLVGLRIFGVNENFLNLLKLFSEGFVQHAHASNHTLTNPLPSDNAYDIIISGISLAMKFFVYPGLIAMWVAAGFKFVYSQGNPEGLKTARNWLLVAVIVTVIAFTLQGFILAFRGTALKVFQGSGTGSTVPSSGSTGSTGSTAPYTGVRVTDCAGKPLNTVCTVGGRDGLCNTSRDGVYGCHVGTCYGQIGLDGVCYTSGRR